MSRARSILSLKDSTFFDGLRKSHQESGSHIVACSSL